jgi:hypothetical protein
MAKNYYAILGVLPTATVDEIRSAYRKCAKEFHPDHFGQDSAPFRNVQEAYDVLGDPATRALYDRRSREPLAGSPLDMARGPAVIRPRRPPAEPLRSDRRPAEVETISPLRSYRTSSPSFDEILENLSNALDLRVHRKSERFHTLTMEVVLTPDQARRGGIVRVLLPIEAQCPTCDGFGSLGFWQCWRCDGTGTLQTQIPLSIEYPAGIKDLYRVAIPLDRFGLHDICPVLLFRISSTADFEDL